MYNELGVAAFRLERYDDAQRALEHVLALWRRLPEASPLREACEVALFNLGQVLGPFLLPIMHAALLPITPQAAEGAEEQRFLARSDARIDGGDLQRQPYFWLVLACLYLTSTAILLAMSGRIRRVLSMQKVKGAGLAVYATIHMSGAAARAHAPDEEGAPPPRAGLEASALFAPL